MTKKMRKDFEAHIAEMIVSQAGLDIALKCDKAGDYETSWVQAGWQFWQGATLKANQWRPIADAPRSADDILALNRSGRQTVTTGHFLHNMMAAAIVDEEDCYYTGWLPLPPTGTGGNHG